MESTEAAVPPTEAVPLFKKRTAKSKSNFRKRPATPPPASDDDSSDYTSSEDEEGRKIKRRKRNTGAITASSTNSAATGTKELTATVFKADTSGNITSVNDATKASNWFDENEEGALSAKNLLGKTRALPSGASGEGTYKGLANQTNFIQKNPNAPTKQIGPLKAPTNIRTITITDMSPDVCKDYRQTGYCGFGDNCKFAHVREDYKHGWQLDKEWENVTKGKKVINGTTVASANRNTNSDDVDEEEAMLENIPFACFICKESYKDPIVTKCGHYFCESCALKRYRKDPSCAACGSGTGGVFSVAKNLRKLLDRKRERIAQRREKAKEAGEEVSEDDEEA